MKKILALLAIAAILGGCASTKISNSTMESRTMKIGNFLDVFTLYESETKGIVIGDAEIVKDGEQ